MGTEILHPQDCLRGVVGPSTVLPRRKPYTSNRKPVEKRYPEVTVLKKSTTTTTTNTNDFVIGQVTILKRGEIPDPKQKIQISVVGSEVLYAGSAFYLSPSPSSLPLPTFSKKKEELTSSSAEAAIVHDSATKDLRRLLRLD